MYLYCVRYHLFNGLYSICDKYIFYIRENAGIRGLWNSFEKYDMYDVLRGTKHGLAQIMACFLKSRYLTICLPFLFCYLYGRVLASVSVKILNLGHIKWMWILDHISFETVFRKDFYSFVFSGLFIVIGYELYKYLAGLNLKRGI